MISEERLREAAQAVSQAMIDSLPEPEDCHHEFSPEFERNMEKLLRRERHRGLYQGMKRAACFFLAIFLSGSVWLSVDAEAREALFGWFSERLGLDQHYFFQGETVTGDGVSYTLSDIPAGYTAYDLYDDGTGFVSNIYQGENEELLRFEYVIGDATETYFLVGDSEPLQVFVNGNPAKFYPGVDEDASNSLVWCDYETGALLYLSGFFEEEILVQMAESITKEKT